MVLRRYLCCADCAHKSLKPVNYYINMYKYSNYRAQTKKFMGMITKIRVKMGRFLSSGRVTLISLTVGFLKRTFSNIEGIGHKEEWSPHLFRIQRLSF